MCLFWLLYLSCVVGEKKEFESEDDGKTCSRARGCFDFVLLWIYVACSFVWSLMTVSGSSRSTGCIARAIEGHCLEFDRT